MQLIVRSSCFVAATFVVACSSSPAEPPPPPADAGFSDPDVLEPPDLPRDQTEAELEPKRASCTFEAGAWAAQTIGKELALGADLPFKHVIVIVQENRSFDNYLGRLVAQGYYDAGDFTTGGTGFQHHDQVDVPPPGWAIPDGSGGMVAPHPDDEYCYGVNHDWPSMHQDWNNGANDGFVINNNPNGQRSLFYEDDTVIPFYYALAGKFAIGDRYFASVMTSTWPNRFYFMAATSFGLGANSFYTDPSPDQPAVQLFTQLEKGLHSWKDYTDGNHMQSFFANFGFGQDALMHYGNVRCDLFSDIEANALPDVAFIMGSEDPTPTSPTDPTPQSSDEGPSALPGIGGQLVEEIIRKLWASPAWKDTVVFITYDENGGMADHVPPVPACKPDGHTPVDGFGMPLEGDFDRTGFRVPFIVVSPYARAHFVSHHVYDHTSITRFIEARFGLPAMSARDANATPPFEMFDFAHPAFMTPPTIDAHTTVPQAILDQCGQKLAPMGCP